MDIEKKQELLERQRQKIMCDVCCVYVTKSGLSQHRKTRKHIDLDEANKHIDLALIEPKKIIKTRKIMSA